MTLQALPEDLQRRLASLLDAKSLCRQVDVPWCTRVATSIVGPLRMFANCTATHPPKFQCLEMAHSANLKGGILNSAVYDRFAAVSRAAHNAAAAAEIRFVNKAYRARKASGAFARRNADRVTSLGAYYAPDFASIQMYRQLRDLKLELGVEEAKIALLPCSLTKLFVYVCAQNIDWEDFRPLRCLQDLTIYNDDATSGITVQLDDSFATALPLLRVFDVSPGVPRWRLPLLETTAKVVMPHLVEFTTYEVNLVHLDLHFMSALKSLTLHDCTISTVSAACSTMILCNCWMRKGTVLETPNLCSLKIDGGGLHRLDGSKCRHALSILCKNNSSIEWVGAKPNVDPREFVEPEFFLIYRSLVMTY